jgi:hypothetical protein
MFSRLDSRRKEVASGEIFGCSLPRANETTPSIAVEIPRAVRDMERKKM